MEHLEKIPIKGIGKFNVRDCHYLKIGSRDFLAEFPNVPNSENAIHRYYQCFKYIYGYFYTDLYMLL